MSLMLQFPENLKPKKQNLVKEHKISKFSKNEKLRLVVPLKSPNKKNTQNYKLIIEGLSFNKKLH